MKGTEITPKVRAIIYERDSNDFYPSCRYCGNPSNLEVHHYISRGRGGLGIPENLILLCHTCHQNLHSGNEEIESFIKDYLSSKYEGWEESKLTHKKGYNKW